VTALSGQRKIRPLPPLRPCRLADVARSAPAVAPRAPGPDPHGELRYLWTDRLPDAFLAEDPARLPCPPLELISLPNVQIRSDWMPYLDGDVIADETIFPAYARQYYHSGLVDSFNHLPTTRYRDVWAPTYVIAHFNMRTYGHFLLEVLPKCLIVRELHAMGLKYRVAFPHSLLPFASILKDAFPEISFLIYDDYREGLRLRTALLPTLPLSPTSHLHDLGVATIKLMTARLSSGRDPDRRIFIVREGMRSFRTLQNERELVAIAAEYGFEPVRPQTMPWAEQVAMFNSASHVIGEFSSALHNTLFCSPAAKVICLNWWLPLQSAVAVSAGHEIGYILPADGVVTEFKPDWVETQMFRIDPSIFRERIEQTGLTPT
jgi:O-antigen biosynthesis protein WbqL